MIRPRTRSGWRRLSVAVALYVASLGIAAAAKVTTTVGGVDGELKLAVLAALELNQYDGRDVSAAQVRRLYDHAPDQVASALVPYGYYDAQVKGELKESPEGWTAVLNVVPGEPVKVGTLNLKLEGEASKLRPVRQALRAFAPQVGDAMSHAAYERGKTAIQAALFASGFLDAKLVTHKVSVTRGTRTAVIDLTWEPGQRYRVGDTIFEGAQFDDGFLDRYVPWKQGDFYTQEQLLSLQQRLTEADYFSMVDVNPDIENAQDGVVNILVKLAPAKRSIYTGGIFVGTDTGFGVRGGLERRWMNRRGHKMKSEAIVAQRLKTLSTLYTIPMPGTDNRSFNFGANFRDEDTKTTRSKTTTIVANETRQWMGFTRTLGLKLQTGDFEIGDRKLAVIRGNSTVLYPEVGLTKKNGDDPLFVRKGYSFNVTARAGKKDVLSDSDFVQMRADAKYIRSPAPRQRLILRGTIASTWASDFDQLPPDLRFFAGGDRSIRGFGYQTVGPLEVVPRTPPLAPVGVVIGGKNLLVASAEYEYYFTRNWGAAAFVDAGDAFSGTDYNLKIGAGLGVRWRSPVGMVRFDLGYPVKKEPKEQAALAPNVLDRGLQIHLVIGPDL
ncbi:MAG TPA: autotransporter assembly complex family protein [Tahibacter sp.]|nr:autotransporter assembly complex family protein [Tahibacter sp.]